MRYLLIKKPLSEAGSVLPELFIITATSCGFSGRSYFSDFPGMQKGKSLLSVKLMFIYLKGGAVVTGRRAEADVFH